MEGNVRGWHSLSAVPRHDQCSDIAPEHFARLQFDLHLIAAAFVAATAIA